MNDPILNELTPAEKSLLAGARDDGMIAFPQGPACVAEQTLKVLKQLIWRGYVRYTRKKNWYRAWWLTRKDRRLVEAIQTFQRESSAPAVCSMH